MEQQLREERARADERACEFVLVTDALRHAEMESQELHRSNDYLCVCMCLRDFDLCVCAQDRRERRELERNECEYIQGGGLQMDANCQLDANEIPEKECMYAAVHVSAFLFLRTCTCTCYSCLRP